MKNRFYLPLLAFILFFLLLNHTFSQIPVSDRDDNSMLAYPWAGGLNSCQFGEIDLNGNGIKDLFVFDRQGNRILTFINAGIPGEINYTYAPQYASKFPELSDWAILADYDGDGKPDIFTYSPGWAGMQVYRNVSGEELAFESVVFPYLTSFQGGGYVNIMATNADYPAIVDLDGDGDLDILTFWALGTYIQQHTNQSMENYGHADSLDYVQTEFCWGRVAEHEETNELFLDTCFKKSAPQIKPTDYRHRGATLRVMDLNNSGLPDLIIGDVDYPGLTKLINGGTIDDAFMVSMDTAFPSYDVPVRLFSMPVTALVDVNNNGLKDLIVSPFDPSPVVSENKNSVWLYLNEGTAAQPLFRLKTKSFLQDQMIDVGSGAYPVLYDMNGNGLKDLIIGNYGYYNYSYYQGGMLFSKYVSKLAYYENTGTADQPAFELMDHDLARLYQLGKRGLVPAIADLTGNGLPDLLLGNEEGSLILVEQTASAVWEVVTQNFGDIHVGSHSAPQLFDVNGNGIVDLIIGRRDGQLTFYEGYEENGQIHFEFVTDELGEVNVTDFNLSWDGFSVPHFFKGPENKLLLAVGSLQGKIFLFEDILIDFPDGPFRETQDWGPLLDTVMQTIDVGMRSSAFVTELYGDGRLSMFAGNYGGGLELFNATVPVSPGLKDSAEEIHFQLFPNPAKHHLTLVLDKTYTHETNIRCYDAKGVLVKSQALEPHHQTQVINIDGLPKGLYLIEITGKSGRGTSKFLK